MYWIVESLYCKTEITLTLYVKYTGIKIFKKTHWGKKVLYRTSLVINRLRLRQNYDKVSWILEERWWPSMWKIEYVQFNFCYEITSLKYRATHIHTCIHQPHKGLPQESTRRLSLFILCSSWTVNLLRAHISVITLKNWIEVLGIMVLQKRMFFHCEKVMPSNLQPRKMEKSLDCARIHKIQFRL